MYDQKALQPLRYVSHVMGARLLHVAKLVAEEGRRDFSDQFFWDANGGDGSQSFGHTPSGKRPPVKQAPLRASAEDRPNHFDAVHLARSWPWVDIDLVRYDPPPQ